MSKEKDKKSKKISINDKITGLRERTDKLDYTVDLTGAVKEYQQISNDIDTCEKELNKLYENLEKEISTDCPTIKDENEFKEFMNKINETIELLENTNDIDKSLKYYNTIKSLIESCKKYELTLTASIKEI